LQVASGKNTGYELLISNFCFLVSCFFLRCYDNPMSRRLSPATSPEADASFMRRALREAQKADSEGEVPVGAVVVRDEKIIAWAHNRPLGLSDPSAHAEVLALRRAAKKLGNYRLKGCDLYVTIEPCAMCAGAIIQARLRRLVYGTPDPKAGACGSALAVLNHPKVNHQVEVVSGVLAQECARILREFFRCRRRRT
jgi:tRNA(adenine34) deaminase